MTILEPGDIDTVKGRWKGGIRDGSGRTAIISCPKCGGFGSLGNHTIKTDGTVEPSVVCPYAKEFGCDFHDHVKLNSWVPST